MNAGLGYALFVSMTSTVWPESERSHLQLHVGGDEGEVIRADWRENNTKSNIFQLFLLHFICQNSIHVLRRKIDDQTRQRHTIALQIRHLDPPSQTITNDEGKGNCVRHFRSWERWNISNPKNTTAPLSLSSATPHYISHLPSFYKFIFGSFFF